MHMSRRRRRTLYTHEGEVGPDSDMVNALIGDGAVVTGSGISLVDSEVRRAKILDAASMTVRGCFMEMVDAAGAGLERSGWKDSTVSESRFTGTRMNDSNMDRVAFSGCKMNLVQCQRSKLRHVSFDACDLGGAYFNGSDLTGTTFEGSDLTGADFSGAVLEGCDFRRANIEDIRVAPEQLRGVIVSSDQALYLARLLGLDIRE